MSVSIICLTHTTSLAPQYIQGHNNRVATEPPRDQQAEMKAAKPKTGKDLGMVRKTHSTESFSSCVRHGEDLERLANLGRPPWTLQSQM